MLKQRSYVSIIALIGGLCLFSFQNCSKIDDVSMGRASAGGGVNSKMSQVEPSSVVVTVNGPSVVKAGAPARYVATAIDSDGNSIVYDWYINGQRVGDRSNVLNIADIGAGAEISVVATSPVNAQSASASIQVTGN